MPSDFKMCLHKLLYYKDCITTRQSWLFSFYVVVNKNNKQDKKKLENITIVFYSITYYRPFLRYTTLNGMHTHYFYIIAGLIIYEFLLYFMFCSALFTPADSPEVTSLVALHAHLAICWALPGLMEAATISTCLPCQVG